jgi:hypothetical protein
VNVEDYAVAKVGDAQDQKFKKVVAVNHQTNKEMVLLTGLPATGNFPNWFAVMSPNGQYLALCILAAKGPIRTTIAVINNKGELVSKIEIAQ